jgi:hypothetical protein
VSDDEIADAPTSCPQDFEPLVAEAQRRFFEIMPAEDFRGKVAERTGLARGAATVPLSRSWRLARRVALFVAERTPKTRMAPRTCLEAALLWGAHCDRHRVAVPVSGRGRRGRRNAP